MTGVNLPAPPFLRRMVDERGFVTVAWRAFLEPLYRLVYGEGFDAPLFVGPLLELVRDAPSAARTW